MQYRCTICYNTVQEYITAHYSTIQYMCKAQYRCTEPVISHLDRRKVSATGAKMLVMLPRAR